MSGARKLLVLLAVLFLLADAAAFLVWWTHPQGARKLGFSGKLPFALPFELPYAAIPGLPAEPAALAAPEPEPIPTAAQPPAAPPAAAEPAPQPEAAPSRNKKRAAKAEDDEDAGGALDDDSFGNLGD